MKYDRIGKNPKVRLSGRKVVSRLQICQGEKMQYRGKDSGTSALSSEYLR
jgi:hypothetical protein